MGDDDDLNAFFDDVSAAEAGADEKSDDGNKSSEEPPSKKVKLTKTSSVAAARPRGIMIAAASQAVASAPAISDQHQPQLQGSVYNNVMSVNAPGTGGYAIGPVNGHNTTNGIHSSPPLPPQPPLPPGPIPPPNPPAADIGPAPPPKKHVRTAGGKVWVDSTLDDWPDNDFRLFVGNLGTDVTDQLLFEHFHAKYPSTQLAKVIRDRKNESKGYGFVSMQEALEMAQALRVMNQSWLGSRPCKVRRCNWKDREMSEVRKKQKKDSKQQKRRGLIG